MATEPGVSLWIQMVWAWPFWAIETFAVNGLAHLRIGLVVAVSYIVPFIGSYLLLTRAFSKAAR